MKQLLENITKYFNGKKNTKSESIISPTYKKYMSWIESTGTIDDIHQIVIKLTLLENVIKVRKDKNMIEELRIVQTLKIKTFNRLSKLLTIKK